MNGPDRDLLRIYGTAKTAGSGSVLARLAMGVVNQQASAARTQQDEARREEAARMNEIFQNLELARMSQVYEGMNPGMTRLAADIGAEIAHIEKDAGVFNALAQGVKGFGAARAVGMEMQPALGFAKGNAVKAFGSPVHAAKAAPALAAPAATAAAPALGPYRKMVYTPSAPAAAVVAPAAAAPVARAAAAAPAKSRASLLGPLGMKGNLALAGGAAGALYLGSKGIDAAKGLASSEERGPATYGPGAYGYRIPAGVNAYGYPQ